MAASAPKPSQSFLRMILREPDGGESSDQSLLERFAATRDEEAFVALVRRHGTLVWGVCWRSLRHIQDAEDCFQATFVVLARRAGSVRWQPSAANWLFGTALRVAAEAKARRARLRSHERPEDAGSAETVMPENAARELCGAIDEELKKLPAGFREPLLLRYLEGRTSAEAAQQLGWPQRTFERRLAQGLERLRNRLTRRGLTASGTLLAIALSEQSARAAVSNGLVAATIRSATSPSATVLALSEAITKGIGMTRLKLAILAVSFLAMTAGTSLLFGNEGGEPLPAVAADPPQPGAEKPANAPEAALARRVWAILDVVEKNHLKPPSRDAVIHEGLRTFFQAAGVLAPEGFDKGIQKVSSEDELRALLRMHWPAKAGEKDIAKLEAAFLEGMFAGIPGRPHLTTPLALKIQDQLRGNRYVGTGVQIGMHEKEKLVQIQVPFRRGPARRAGAKPGDLIVEVDGKSTAGLENAEEMAKLLRGPEGTTVTIVVRQPGETETRTLKVVRGAIPIDSTFGYKRVGEDGWDYVVDAKSRIAYVWVKSMNAGTLHELRRIENRLQKDGMRALVLDFRFSRGDGGLHDAGLVAGGFLDNCLLWTVTDVRNPPKDWKSGSDTLFSDWPVAVLVNGIEDGAQSAVIAALQDNRRAVLVGEPTKTDGAVRQLFRLPDESNITVQIGELVRADKTRGWPVKPDREVELNKEQRAAVEKWLMMKVLPILPKENDDKAPADPQFDAAVGVLRDALKKEPAPKESK